MQAVVFKLIEKVKRQIKLVIVVILSTQEEKKLQFEVVSCVLVLNILDSRDFWFRSYVLMSHHNYQPNCHCNVLNASNGYSFCTYLHTCFNPDQSDKIIQRDPDVLCLLHVPC